MIVIYLCPLSIHLCNSQTQQSSRLACWPCLANGGALAAPATWQVCPGLWSESRSRVISLSLQLSQLEMEEKKECQKHMQLGLIKLIVHPSCRAAHIPGGRRIGYCFHDTSMERLLYRLVCPNRAIHAPELSSVNSMRAKIPPPQQRVPPIADVQSL